uniref:3-hydroxyacyl-CoA dehydrogenase type-2 n=1 Tax=Rhabditophanes sp. KR3021 TaxID=114890 RepID=A0AC35UGM8_9BILA
MSSVLKNIKGSVAFITGASSGLGRGTAERLISQGAKVVIFDLPKSEGAKVAESLGTNAIFVGGDVTNDKSVIDAFNQTKNKFGKLDAIVNCAGIAYAFKLYNLNKQKMCDFDRVKQTIEVNLLGSLNVIRHGVVLMGENQRDDQNQRGVIINTASVAAFDGQIGQVAYSASKGGIVGSTLPLARDFAKDGIRVNTIAPGLFHTPMLASLPEKVQTFLAATVPNPSRLGNVEEYGALVQHIIENRYINGEIIRLDGAIRMMP